MGVWDTGDLPNGWVTAFELCPNCLTDAERKLIKRKGIIKLQG
jgi:hypothetical protein